MKPSLQKALLPAVILGAQTLFLILFGVFAVYDYSDLSAKGPNGSSEVLGYVPDDYSESIPPSFYPMFQDVHVMMFIGFGFLMTFLKRYGLSAVSLNFVVAALVLQWYMILSSLFSSHVIFVSLHKLIGADFAAAAVLISFGAVLGKTSPFQLIWMALLEIVFFCLNEYLAASVFGALDVGGSMVVHTFGAYFGLTVARVIYKEGQDTSSNEGSNSTSDLFSMIGTVFLWLFWPSFNSAIAPTEDLLQRSIINTYLSLAACTLVTFALSVAVDEDGKLNMVHIQNATLAGGVAVGTSADLLIGPWGAILIGMIAGALSVIGFTYIQPFLLAKLRLHDTCGVHNLHGMPGVLAGIIGAVVVAVSSPDKDNMDSPGSGAALFPAVVSGDRTMGEQAGFQALTLFVSMAVGIGGGLITGLLLQFVPGCGMPEGEDLFNDKRYFSVAQEEEDSCMSAEKEPEKVHLQTATEDV